MSKKTTAPKTPSPIQRLRKTERQADDLDHLDHAFEDHGTHRGKYRLPLTDVVGDLSVSTVLAAAMLYEALTPRDRRRIAMGKGLAMTVAVATADWIDPVADALYRAHEWKDILKRSGSSRTTDRPEVGNEACANALGGGRSILGVSTAPERYLPSVLMAAADLRVALGNPSTQAIRRTIQIATGRRPGQLAGDLVRGLSPTEIVACVRKGSTASACVRRLRAASASKRTDADVGLEAVPYLTDRLGLGEAGEWGLRLVSAVEEYRRGERPWSSIEDRNVVLAGDAGVGKTTFARSLAKSAGVPLIATSVSTWFASGGGYLNEIVRAVDALFARAAAMGGPVVILLDECDAIPNRSTVDSRHRDFWVPVVSHVLLALDSAVSAHTNQFIVIGATNFPERLDEALVRPGRLNRIVHIPLPDIPAVAGILRQHLGDALPGVDLMPLANIGAGATGAEIAGWAKGARMVARQAGREMVLRDLVDQAAPPETRSTAHLLAVARHEASHCYATEALLVGTITTVSLVAKGAFAGRTSARLRETQMMSAEDLDGLVISILAGRAADGHWGRVTSGSAGSQGSDLAHATSLVAGKHASWCLGQSILYRCDQTEALSLVRADASMRAIVEADLNRLYGLAVDLVLQDLLDVRRLPLLAALERVVARVLQANRDGPAPEAVGGLLEDALDDFLAVLPEIDGPLALDVPHLKPAGHPGGQDPLGRRCPLGVPCLGDPLPLRLALLVRPHHDHDRGEERHRFLVEALRRVRLLVHEGDDDDAVVDEPHEVGQHLPDHSPVETVEALDDKVRTPRHLPLLDEGVELTEGALDPVEATVGAYPEVREALVDHEPLLGRPLIRGLPLPPEAVTAHLLRAREADV